MRLGGRVDTSQIEDRRGGGRGLAVGGGGLGVVGLILALVFGLSGGGGGDVNQILRQLQPDAGAAQGNAQPLDCSKGASESTACFVTAVVNDVQATWADIFRQQGRTYRETKLVLYTQATPTQGCGMANSAVGPFYCPGDEKVYLDLGFFQELRNRFGAPGDFAQAYVIAHEFGHHVQNLLGTMGKVDRVRRQDRSQDNPLSVRLELQADCYAGIWAHDTAAQPDPHDFDEALDAAAAVGDDRLQKQAGQRVNQDTWTHGSSAERMQWFQTGAKRGNLADCNTFASGAVP
ncbi:MAG TPA: neutral zinc metallopeptidase [Mycobacteriales bacterium]|nr:neutral zinc metallopeptidase [Mycobacteriales bacterium]